MRPLLLVLLLPAAHALRPKFSWDTLGHMTFFHACNESGLFSEAALDTIEKFPMVTIEKGAAVQPRICSRAHGSPLVYSCRPGLQRRLNHVLRHGRVLRRG